MTVARRCQFCGQTADGQVRAHGLPAAVLYCTADACWEQAYTIVRHRVPRMWGPVTPERKTRRPPGQTETLF